jgi:DeoR/GlpR family transcriptional regulator of sugar metabolism
MRTTEQRRAAILALLDRHGSVRHSDLAGTLGVATTTIRRDLQVLACDRPITPVHGGAFVTWPRSRQATQEDEDTAIAQCAAEMVAPYATVGLGSGPINVRIAHFLARIPGLTVVTVSPAIARVFDNHRSQMQQIILVGGVVTPDGGCVGSIALQAIRQLALDQLFLQVCAFDSTRGLLSPSHLQAETERVLIDAANRFIVVANHTAWNTISLAPLASLATVTTLITSTALNADAQFKVRAAVGDLRLVDARPPATGVYSRSA